MNLKKGRNRKTFKNASEKEINLKKRKEKKWEKTILI